jgi:hypothetical protein
MMAVLTTGKGYFASVATPEAISGQLVPSGDRAAAHQPRKSDLLAPPQGIARLTFGRLEDNTLPDVARRHDIDSCG